MQNQHWCGFIYKVARLPTAGVRGGQIALAKRAAAAEAAEALAEQRQLAGLDEGILTLSLSNLLYMENPNSYKKWQ